jgi:hypothetical protein
MVVQKARDRKEAEKMHQKTRKLMATGPECANREKMTFSRFINQKEDGGRRLVFRRRSPV